jgi:hypothetical protein
MAWSRIAPQMWHKYGTQLSFNGSPGSWCEVFINSNGRSGLESGGVAGSQLTAADIVAPEARWIDRELTSAARLRRVDSLTGAEPVGRKGGDYSGIAIPYFLPGASDVREYRLRRDHPEMEINAQGSRRERSSPVPRQGRARRNNMWSTAAMDEGFEAGRPTRSAVLTGNAPLARIRWIALTARTPSARTAL